jgi:hypothetical protein
MMNNACYHNTQKNEALTSNSNVEAVAGESTENITGTQLNEQKQQQEL